MRNPGGYAVIVEPGQPVVEYDTVTCCHCGAIIKVKPGSAATVYLVFDPLLWIEREEPGAGCWHCGKPVCLRCHADGRCFPLERQLEAAEGKLGPSLIVGGLGG